MKINKKITTSVAGASLVLTLLGFLSKGIGFIREIIYANNFGLSSEFDLFLSSIALPNLINTAIIFLSQHYFVPSYNRIKKVSESDGIDFFNYTFWWFIIGGLVLALLLYLFSGLIFQSYLGAISLEKQQLGIKIFKMFIITIPLNAGMSIIMAFKQAEFKFTYPAISLILLNVIVIILVLLFSDILRIIILPISFVIGYFAAFAFLAVLVKENLKFLSQDLFKVKNKFSEIRILIALIIIEGSSLSYVLIDRYFITDVSVGGISALNYAFVIFSLPISLFSIPLITTMFSKFSNSPQTLNVDYKNSLNMNFFIMIPFMFILLFWGDHFLRFFYERGKFSASDTLTTYSALQYYSLSLIFLSSYFLIVKILYSLNQYLFILKISIVAFVLKIFLNIWLVKDFQQNGLALSTTITYMFLLLTGYFFGIKKMMSKEYYSPFLSGFYFILNASLSYSCVKVISSLFNLEHNPFSLLGLVLFSILFLANSYYTDDTEFNIIKRTLLGMFR